MTESEARALIAERFDVPRGTMQALDAFVNLLQREAAYQNLISAGTLDRIWSRHILDSAQLLAFAPPVVRQWIDLGTGAGFPGLIVGALSSTPTLLVESRKKRIAFLQAAINLMGLGHHIRIWGGRLETLPATHADVISARAFAPLDRLLELAARFADRNTIWLLPKGRSAPDELAAVGGTWQGRFRVEASLTDPDSAIIVADHVERRRGR